MLESKTKTIIPILIVSGHPIGEYKEISQSFFTAWDYIEKPVESLDYLVSMTRKLLIFANRQTKAIGKPNEKTNNLSFKDSDVLWKNKRISLPMTLYKFLRCLIKNKNTVVTFNMLHAETSSCETDQVRRKGNVRAHINRLREAFKNVDSDFDAIKPEYGKGYSWEDDN